ncbi:MAG: GGDEF domain-containing protein [Arenimonas sp.]|nr:GGDEF domain-containing protein [Arenimonas sp.]
MSPHPLRYLASALHRAFEGEMAALTAQERHEQHGRQMDLLHPPLANLLLAMALLQAANLALNAAFHWPSLPVIAWQGVSGLLLLAFAYRYRALVSARKRVAVGFVFLVLLLGSLVEPGQRLQDLPVMSLAGFLLLPVAGLPLLVRPPVALGGLALCTAATAWMLGTLQQITDEDRLAFGFYYAASVTAGLVLRRARGNLAVRMGREVESLWQRAVSDPLTGLLNRDGWMNLAGTAMQDAIGAGHQPAVLFIDMDFFKRVNDEHGHQAGDELLRELGGIIDARIGTGEFSARLGGEEFACLLPRSSVHQAERFAQRLANDYRERARRFDSTLSIGVATYSAGDLLNDLLARADAALYEAKHRGRDQIVVAAN